MPKKLDKNLMVKRDYKVVKANTLIQNSRFNLTTQAQKCILYIISKIKPDEEDFKEVNFSILEFCEVCGLEKNSGASYQYIKNTLKGLRDESIWIKLDDSSETTLAWIDKVTINKQSGIVKLKIDEMMKPYLLQLKEKFTQYELMYTLAMKSQYSIRLYELLKSYEWKHTVKFNIEELKKIISAENYIRFSDFRRKVIEIGIGEIEKFSDITITYEFEKEGKKYINVIFDIRKKNIEEKIDALENITSRIGN